MPKNSGRSILHRETVAVFCDSLSVARLVIKPTDTWITLTKKEEQALLIFERKIFRRIYGPKFEIGEWKSRTNREVEEMSKEENTVIPWNPNLIRSRTPFEFQIVRVPRQIFPFKIIETGLIRSWVPRTRIFKIILTVNTLDFKVKY